MPKNLVIQGWTRRCAKNRKRLYHQHQEIQAVRADADRLIDELEMRRDGWSPQQLDLPTLRSAILRVDKQMSSPKGHSG